jgi:hypothetical protein
MPAHDDHKERDPGLYVDLLHAPIFSLGKSPRLVQSSVHRTNVLLFICFPRPIFSILWGRGEGGREAMSRVGTKSPISKFESQ